MGGLTPGIGGLEWVVIGLVALVVVGPERLPGLLRQMGKWVAKARGMANEFRASFDEMARQSELDDLRKEVEALRTGQSPYSPVRLGAEADAAFKDIKSELERPLTDEAVAADPAMTPQASEWPDGEPVMLPLADPPLVALPEEAPVVPVAAKPARKPRAKAAPAASAPVKAKAAIAAKLPVKVATKAPAKAKPRAPRNSKLDL